MRRRYIMEMVLDLHDVLEAIRMKYPEIPADAVVAAINEPGKGPGSRKDTRGVQVQPFVKVVFPLPLPRPPVVLAASSGADGAELPSLPSLPPLPNIGKPTQGP